nr:hypothetical protein [Citrobacter freundii]
MGENLTTRLIAADIFNVQPCDPTRKDFLYICNKCFKQGVAISTYARWACSDGETIWLMLVKSE